MLHCVVNTHGRCAGGISKSGEESGSNVRAIRHIYAILIGLFSSIAGGVTYCLVRAASKASDQPV